MKAKDEDNQQALLLGGDASERGLGSSSSAEKGRSSSAAAAEKESKSNYERVNAGENAEAPDSRPSPAARRGCGDVILPAGVTEFCLGFVVCLAVVVCAVAFVGLPVGGSNGGGDGFQSQQQQQQSVKNFWGYARARKLLSKPVVILISSDGFRWNYNYKVPTPNIEKLRVNGTETDAGLIPVYPTLTFPNHYSIVTGLYPAWHGIIENYFSDPENPRDGEPFTQSSKDPKWWLGEPIWETVTKNGLQAATFFWPGSEVKKGLWTCPPQFCKAYNESVPYEERVDTVLEYFDLPEDQLPSYMSLYFESPDEEGHKVGSDDPEISKAVAEIDSLLGRLITGLEKRGVFEDVNIILLGDHGMVANCDAKVIYVEDFKPWVEIDYGWIDSTGAIFAIRVPVGTDAKDVYSKIKAALASGKVENGDSLQLFLKEELPERLLYSTSDRVQPIIGIPAEGYKVVYQRTNASQCGGSHGYDNSLQSMRPIFVAHGPQFARGRKAPSFVNVELYNVFTSILNLKLSAPNNGSSAFPSTLLLPSR